MTDITGTKGRDSRLGIRTPRLLGRDEPGASVPRHDATNVVRPASHKYVASVQVEVWIARRPRKRTKLRLIQGGKA